MNTISAIASVSGSWRSPLKSTTLVLGCLLVAGCGCGQNEDVKLLGQLFTGVFDNFEQRRQQSEGEGNRQISVRGQYRIMQMSDDMAHLYLELHGEQRNPDNGAPELVLTREATYTLQADSGEVVMHKQMHNMQDGCTLNWKRTSGQRAFTADDVQGGCLPVMSARAQDTSWHLRLDDEGLALCPMRAECTASDDDWQAYRRGLIFTGWMAMHPDGPRPSRPTARSQLTVFASNLTFQSEGGTHWFKDEQGRLTGYGIRLERPSYNGDIRVLKLGVVRLADNYTLAYSWAGADSTRIGINRRWLQAGLTLNDGVSQSDPP